jgi:hypothetical protein
MELKLFLMDCRICPLDGTHFFNWLVLFIDNDDVIAHGFLDSLRGGTR